MMDYQRLYTHLFRVVTRSIELMEQGAFVPAKEILILGQQETEAMYLEMEE
ncbi:MAG: hypothetical protein ACOX7N_00190 [Lawsonibacter sp.]|jgi:hypothetical protein